VQVSGCKTPSRTALNVAVGNAVDCFDFDG